MALGKETSKNYLLIKDIVDKNPYATLENIGHAIGLTRERVRQIIIQVKAEAYDGIIEPIERISGGGRFQAYCIECGKKLSTAKKGFESGSKMCRECKKAKPVVFFCFSCGKETIKSTPEDISRYKQNKKRATKNTGHNFCSKQCSGRWVGVNKGFGLLKTRNKSLNERRSGD